MCFRDVAEIPERGRWYEIGSRFPGPEPGVDYRIGCNQNYCHYCNAIMICLVIMTPLPLPVINDATSPTKMSVLVE